MPLAYNPINGLKDTVAFPTNPADENAARKQIQDMFDFVKDYVNATEYLADSGSTDAYAVSFPAAQAPASYTAGMNVTFKANTINTGVATLNVNGLGAKTIKKNVVDDLKDGDIKAGQIVTVAYDGTNFQLSSPVSDKAQSLTSSGYFKFNNGLIIQWGTTSTFNGSLVVTLPIAFPNAHFMGMATTYNGAYAAGYFNNSLTQATITNTLSSQVMYLAIGY